MEASTNQLADPQMPIYDNLPSKILCRVINVELKVGFWFLGFINLSLFL